MATMNTDSSWRDRFEQQGFLVVENVLSAQVLTRLRRTVEGIVRCHSKLASSLRGRLRFAGTPPWENFALSNVVAPPCQQIGDLTLFGRPFVELLCHAPLLDVIETLLGTSEFAFRHSGCRIRHTGDPAAISGGDFHREADPLRYTSPHGLVTILPLEEMSSANGGTRFIRGSHRISDEAAMSCCVAQNLLPDEGSGQILTPTVPAGAVLFVSYKVIHAAGPMEAASALRRTITLDWTGKDALPTMFMRPAHSGLRPRSQVAAYQEQMRMTFPRHLADGGSTCD